MNQKIDELSIATIRSLCIDMINTAKSGHPGVALGAAPMLYTLYTRHLIANPKDPNWFNRDRFVLSAGHGSSLLYAILHLCGYAVSLDDLKNFRQLGSITTGHPEINTVPGVDASTGPLGQGLGEAVGLAMAEQMVANMYPRGDLLSNHYTYALCGDGCLEEGISQEVITFAGNQKLNKLIVLYDSNNITLDGPLSLSTCDDVKGRFISARWNFIEVEDGNDVDAIDNAIKQAKHSKDKPTLIKVNTIIGYGASSQGTSKVHGAPIGIEDGLKTKQSSYKFVHPDFFIPEEVKQYFADTFAKRGEKYTEVYNEDLVSYQNKYKVEAKRFLALKNNDVSEYLPNEFPEFDNDNKATRATSGKILNTYMLSIPNLFGGSADVASSVMTNLNGIDDFTPSNRKGHNIRYGIRELAMSTIANGLLLHGGIRTYVGSFFVFSDYLKPAMRMASQMKLPVIYLFSHDSIAVGEDGPSHQPIEQLATLRSMPNINVIRPADEKETYGAWRNALRSTETPTAIILSRQGLTQNEGTDANKVDLGAYVVSSSSKAKYIIIATGSEVNLALKVKDELAKSNIFVKVVSMPSMELFDKQEQEYKDKVLDLPYDKRISLEMLSTFGWGKYAKYNYGIDQFGVSGKANDVIDHFGFTIDKVVEFIKAIK